ncbi:MAG: penicillin-insensitive murein endopeptidase [Chloroflexota bacterium]
MPIVLRRLIPVVFATLLLAALAPGAMAATTHSFPNQSLGNRGSDVRAIQGLLRARGSTIVVDGTFGPTTRDAVMAFQAAHGLTADGVVRTTTWENLVLTLRTGSTGEAVMALQRELNDKRKAGLTVNGLYSTATRNAVIAFQRHIGMTPHGTTGAVTWRNLIWHYDYPSFSAAKNLCDYSVGNGKANWGTGAAIGQLEAASKAFAAKGHGRVSVGDASYEHGGNIPLHQTHERGLDIDIRPIRDSENQCLWGTNWRFASYDRAATRQLVDIIRATAPGHVKLIYFNDPVLIREGRTTWFAGHDDHLHIRYCEKSYPIAQYRC